MNSNSYLDIPIKVVNINVSIIKYSANETISADTEGLKHSQ